MEQKEEPLKRGRGSQKKTKVLVMAESKAVENPKPGKKSRKVGHIKMKVIQDIKSETIDNVVAENVSEKSTIKSDDSTSYVGLCGKVGHHTPKVIKNKEIEKELPWVHIAISNAKSWILSNCSRVDKDYIQNYLDEFCYNFNRRYMGDLLFDRLLVACVSSKNEFRYI
jgi:hypothetical protein